MLILLDESISILGKDFKYIKMVQRCHIISNSKHPLVTFGAILVIYSMQKYLYYMVENAVVHDCIVKSIVKGTTKIMCK